MPTKPTEKNNSSNSTQKRLTDEYGEVKLDKKKVPLFIQKEIIDYPEEELVETFEGESGQVEQTLAENEDTEPLTSKDLLFQNFVDFKQSRPDIEYVLEKVREWEDYEEIDLGSCSAIIDGKEFTVPSLLPREIKTFLERWDYPIQIYSFRNKSENFNFFISSMSVFPRDHKIQVIVKDKEKEIEAEKKGEKYYGDLVKITDPEPYYKVSMGNPEEAIFPVSWFYKHKSKENSDEEIPKNENENMKASVSIKKLQGVGINILFDYFKKSYKEKKTIDPDLSLFLQKHNDLILREFGLDDFSVLIPYSLGPGTQEDRICFGVQEKKDSHFIPVRWECNNSYPKVFRYLHDNLRGATYEYVLYFFDKSRKEKKCTRSIFPGRYHFKEGIIVEPGFKKWGSHQTPQNVYLEISSYFTGTLLETLNWELRNEAQLKSYIIESILGKEIKQDNQLSI